MAVGRDPGDWGGIVYIYHKWSREETKWSGLIHKTINRSMGRDGVSEGSDCVMCFVREGCEQDGCCLYDGSAYIRSQRVTDSLEIVEKLLQF